MYNAMTNDHYAGDYTPNLKPALFLGIMLVAFVAAACGLFIYAKSQQSKPAPVAKKTTASEPPAVNTDRLWQVGVPVAGFAIVVLHVLLLIWVVRDAKNRSIENGFFWMLLVLLLGPLALLIYLASRPYGTLATCLHCGNRKLDYARVCPHCRTTA